MARAKFLQMILVLLVLAITSLACNLPSRNGAIPPTAVPMSEAEAGQLEESLKATLANPEGEVTLTITQQQINAYMISQFVSQGDQIISDPVVVLTDNQIELYGKLVQRGLSVNTKMVFQARVDLNGNPKLDVISIDLGGLPAPDSLISQIETLVDGILVNYLETDSTRFKVTSITIGEGQMTVTGTSQQR